MNLNQLIAELTIPSWNEYREDAAGTITLGHKEIMLELSGGYETREVSEMQSEYVAFLGLVRDHPKISFTDLYSLACSEYGYPADEGVKRQYRENIIFFALLGGLVIEDPDLEPRDPDNRFSLDREGLSQIEVLDISAGNQFRAFEFDQYFPK